MAGLGKGLAVIEAFGPDRPRMTVADAARASDTTRAAARRCLLTLEQLGYLTHDGRYFAPTPRMLRLGAAFLDASALPRLAQPYLESARDELTEAVSLTVLEGDWSVFIARAETQRIVSTGVRLGARLPAHASATGRILLAALPDERVGAVLARARLQATTPRTVVDVARLRALVVQARSTGVTYTDEELELGMRSMAVPVRDGRGRTVAAMSVSAFTARVSLEQLRDRFLPVLRGHAERLGRLL
jgi:IclR family pca regulon transcriptional regulator